MNNLLQLPTQQNSLAASAQTIAQVMQRWNFVPPEPYEPVTTAIPKLEAFVTWADKALQRSIKH